MFLALLQMARHWHRLAALSSLDQPRAQTRACQASLHTPLPPAIEEPAQGPWFVPGLYLQVRSSGPEYKPPWTSGVKEVRRVRKARESCLGDVGQLCCLLLTGLLFFFFSSSFSFSLCMEMTM